MSRSSSPAQHHRPRRFAWARLNADTILLGLLAIIGGSYDLIDPAHDETVQALGHPTPAFFLYASVYVISGLLILYALARRHTVEEVVARLLLLAGILIQTVRTGLAVGWDEPTTFERYALLVVIGLVSWLRLSALLSPEGLIVTIPGRSTHP